MSSSTTPPPPSRTTPVSAVRGRALRERAARVVRSDSPPTWFVPGRGIVDGIDQAHARAVIDLALRVGEALLSTGASASDVVATALRLTDRFQLGASCHVDVTYTSISISYHRGEGADPMTVLRIVKVRSADFSRLENLQTLVREVVNGDLDVASARARLDDISGAPHPYRRWLVTFSLAVMGGAVGLFLGGGPLAVLLSAGTTALVDRVQRRLAHRGLAAFFTQAVGAAIPTMVAVLLIAGGSRSPALAKALPPSLVVATGIVVLLAGLSVVGAAQDAIDGYYVTAGARGFEVLMLTFGVVVGVGAVLAVGRRIGVPLDISAQAHLAPNEVVQVVAAMLVAGAFAISAYAGGRAAFVAMGTGGLGWLAFLGASGLSFGTPVASGIAAAVVGVVAQVVSSRLRVPSLAVTTAGIAPLLPGLAVYRGLFEILGRSSGVGPLDGASSLFMAAGIGMALAAGVSFGTFVARPLRTELDRGQRRALRRSTGEAARE
ncbi:threonine/serine ThrE exporter family protein [Oryzihumus sp.]|uniref:threonine/serine ThrE exporter family protein n=1 Tax=Oryzihumus sp. TaxID=1968903 RepID=UPI002ED9CB26